VSVQVHSSNSLKSSIDVYYRSFDKNTPSGTYTRAERNVNTSNLTRVRGRYLAGGLKGSQTLQHLAFLLVVTVEPPQRAGKGDLGETPSEHLASPEPTTTYVLSFSPRQGENDVHEFVRGVTNVIRMSSIFICRWGAALYNSRRLPPMPNEYQRYRSLPTCPTSLDSCYVAQSGESV
jgi:hypothetical protein